MFRIEGPELRVSCFELVVRGGFRAGVSGWGCGLGSQGGVSVRGRTCGRAEDVWDRHLLSGCAFRERDLFADNLLVRIHLIIETFLVDRPRR